MSHCVSPRPSLAVGETQKVATSEPIADCLLPGARSRKSDLLQTTPLRTIKPASNLFRMSLCPRLLLPICIAAVALNGCSRAQQAFEAVQMCVDDQDGVADLKNIMSAVAQSEGLQFIDNGTQQGAELKRSARTRLWGVMQPMPSTFISKVKMGWERPQETSACPLTKLEWVSPRATIQSRLGSLQIT